MNPQPPTGPSTSRRRISLDEFRTRLLAIQELRGEIDKVYFVPQSTTQIRFRLRQDSRQLSIDIHFRFMASDDWARRLLDFPLEIATIMEYEDQMQDEAALATPPLIYDDLYDVLRGPHFPPDRPNNGTNYYCPLCGSHHLQTDLDLSQREVRSRYRRHYRALGNRALVHMRQARALAHLDTSTMDQEILTRIMRGPTCWGMVARSMRELFIRDVDFWEYLTHAFPS